jgi:hypothetical protein
LSVANIACHSYQDYQSEQAVQQVPSNDEINALVNKAVEKVNEFDKALRGSLRIRTLKHV